MSCVIHVVVVAAERRAIVVIPVMVVAIMVFAVPVAVEIGVALVHHMFEIPVLLLVVAALFVIRVLQRVLIFLDNRP